MGNSNNNLNLSKKLRNDEFYTQYNTIERLFNPISYYFEDKSILCNCNDVGKNFHRYFLDNFDKFKLKKLILMHFGENRNKLFGNGGYYIEYTDSENFKKFDNIGSGSFSSVAGHKLLDECDLCITNPPFSKINEYYQTLKKHDVQFIFFHTLLFLTTSKSITVKEFLDENIFPYTIHGIQYDSHLFKFEAIDGNIMDLNNVCLWTNINEFFKPYKLDLNKKFDDENYEKFDNSDIIIINSKNDIPVDYNGIMAVPYNYILYHDKNKFNMLGDTRYPDGINRNPLYFKGKELFRKLLIQKIQNNG